MKQARARAQPNRAMAQVEAAKPAAKGGAERERRAPARASRRVSQEGAVAAQGGGEEPEEQAGGRASMGVSSSRGFAPKKLQGRRAAREEASREARTRPAAPGHQGEAGREGEPWEIGDRRRSFRKREEIEGEVEK